MSDKFLTRRRLLTGAASLVGAGALGAWYRLGSPPSLGEILGSAEHLNRGLQQAMIGREALAREYSPADVSPYFKPNGTQDAGGLPPEYMEDAENGFPEWRLEVGGLVARPTRFTLAEVRALPARSQITRHDCVEGWSVIGGWRGPQLSTILNRVGLLPEARYIVFYCADEFPFYFSGLSSYYESIDLLDAFHPQTILAHEMNGAPLTIAHGAPLRLRVERQLGYKMAKFVHRIEAVARFDDIHGGNGSYWADNGYAWYAGI